MTTKPQAQEQLPAPEPQEADDFDRIVAYTEEKGVDLSTRVASSTIRVVERIAEYYRLAQYIAQSGMTSYQKPEAVLAIILKGQELGIQPMQALAAIHFDKGRLVIEASLMRAIAMRAGVRFTIDQWDKTTCRMTFYRDGHHPVPVEFSEADAKDAGLLSKNTYQAYMKDMLMARCTARGCRIIAADILAGTYTSDELDQIAPPLDVPPMGPQTLAARLAKLDEQDDATEEPAEPAQNDGDRHKKAQDELDRVTAAHNLFAIAEEMSVPVEALAAWFEALNYGDPLAGEDPRAFVMGAATDELAEAVMALNGDGGIECLSTWITALLFEHAERIPDDVTAQIRARMNDPATYTRRKLDNDLERILGMLD